MSFCVHYCVFTILTRDMQDTIYVDCTDYVVMQKLEIPYILSFDEFHKRMRLKAPHI
jgi:predicted nucleic acid-binding protein